MGSKQTSREFRIFISSTFLDMQGERDVLVKRIFPQIRKLCESRAVIFTEIDLRWGITSESVAEGKVLTLCLAEIDRCYPNFLCFLGERYGWIPEEISEDVLDAYPWVAGHGDESCSVTELEILHGVLNRPSRSQAALFYFRAPSFVESQSQDRRLIYSAESASASVRLASLKTRIRAAYQAGQLIFAPVENYTDPDSLAARVLLDLSRLIDEQFPAGQVPDDLQQEALRHEAYALSRRRGFIGRQDILRALTNHVCTDEAAPTILFGDPGCGKSAVLAQWVEIWKEENPADLVIEHYIGSTPASANWQDIVKRVCGEIKSAFQLIDDLPTKPESLRDALTSWIAKAAGSRRVILALDGINQLSASSSNSVDLHWLPWNFPRNIRVVVSTLEGDAFMSLCGRGWKPLKVSLFDATHVREAIGTYLENEYGKRLSENIIEKLSLASQTRNALYLRTLLEELRQYGSHENLADYADYYLGAANAGELFRKIISRWKADFSNEECHDFVGQALNYIACSRLGLSESELLDLLSASDQPLPRHYWAPFFLSAEFSFSIKNGLINFGHDVFRQQVLNDLTQDVLLRCRLALTNYFLREKHERRSISEWPWQLASLALDNTFNELLKDTRTLALIIRDAPSVLFEHFQAIGRVRAQELLNDLVGREGHVSRRHWDFDATISVARFLCDWLGEYKLAIRFYNVVRKSRFSSVLQKAIATERIGTCNYFLDGISKAISYAGKALRQYQSINYWAGVADCHTALSYAYYYLRKHALARSNFESAVEILTRTSDLRGLAFLLKNAGTIKEGLDAVPQVMESISLYSRLGDEYSRTIAEANLCVEQFIGGNYIDSSELGRITIAKFRKLSIPRINSVLNNYALSLIALGEDRYVLEAKECLEEALALTSNGWEVAGINNNLAACCMLDGNQVAAEFFLEAASQYVHESKDSSVSGRLQLTRLFVKDNLSRTEKMTLFRAAKKCFLGADDLRGLVITAAHGVDLGLERDVDDLVTAAKNRYSHNFNSLMGLRFFPWHIVILE